MKITWAEKIYDCTGLEPTNPERLRGSLDCRLLVLFDRQGMSANELETDLYFYHTDHLGSSSWITDATGSAYQHIQSLPYGAPKAFGVIDQRTSSWTAPYRFTGKPACRRGRERDSETGFDYIGARYLAYQQAGYDSELSIWLSVDPLSDKYPHLSPFMYAEGNPVMIIDPNGMNTIKSDADIAKENLNNKLSAMTYSSAPIKNVVIGIRAVEEEYNKLKENNKQGDYENWHVIVAKDIGDGHNQLKQYMSENGIEKLDNLIISSHGNSSALAITEPYTYFEDGVTKMENALEVTAISEYGTGDFQYWGSEIRNAAESLKSVASLVKDGGNLIFTACNTGNSGYARWTHLRFNSMINIYTNQDAGLVFGGKLSMDNLSAGTFFSHANEVDKFEISISDKNIAPVSIIQKPN